MRVYLLKKENYKKVEEIITKNEKTSMLSIYFREMKSLGFDDDRVALILDGLEEYLKIAEEILGNLVTKPEKDLEEKIIQKFKEEEERAKEGFGFLFS